MSEEEEEEFLITTTSRVEQHPLAFLCRPASHDRTLNGSIWVPSTTNTSWLKVRSREGRHMHSRSALIRLTVYTDLDLKID